MPMFFDEEEKKPEKQRSRLYIWTRRALIALAVLAGLFGAGLVILSTMGGAGPSMQKAVKTFAAGSTGYELSIDKFNYAGFFPEVRLDIDGLTFTSGGKRVASAAALDFRMSFWDLLLSRKRYRELAIENFRADPGAFTERALRIDDLSLQKNAFREKPGLSLSGAYGEDSFSFKIGLAMKETDEDHPLFILARENPFLLRIGSLEVDGHYKKGLFGTDFTIDKAGAPDKVLSGVISTGGGMIGQKLKGELEIGSSKLSLKLKYNRDRLRGDADFSLLDLKDIGPALTFANSIASYLPGSDDIDLSGIDMVLRTEIARLDAGGVTLGSISAPLTVRDGSAVIAPIQGKISGGLLSGEVRMDARRLPAKLDIATSIKDWDYGDIQEGLLGKADIKGRADFNIKLSASARSFEGLINGLNGEAVLIGGEGKLASKAINRWGAGLINAMLPSLDPESELAVNCVIADFKLENSVARPDPLFVDTKRVTVAGDGKIDFPAGTINLKLDPKSKDTALLDVATAVAVTGPLSNPSVSPEGLSLFSKLGGLALGVVNPAFLAFSMTDLGLTEQHPCHKYIGKPPEQEKDTEEAPLSDQDERQAGGGESKKDEEVPATAPEGAQVAPAPADKTPARQEEDGAAPTDQDQAVKELGE